MPGKLRQPKVENWNELRSRLYWAYEGIAKARVFHFRGGGYGIPAWLILDGELTLRFASGDEHFTAGRWVFPKFEEGEQHFTEGARILSVRFDYEWADGEPLFGRSNTVSVLASDADELTQQAQLLVAITEKEDLTWSSNGQSPATLDGYLSMQQAFFGWLNAYSKLMQSQGAPVFVNKKLDERVWRATSFMEARSFRRPLKEAEIAMRVGLSVTQLNRLFMADLGMSIAEYWENNRVRMASSALQDSSRSIKEIAFSLGFSSLPHFSVWSKKRLGRSPRAYREYHGQST